MSDSKKQNNSDDTHVTNGTKGSQKVKDTEPIVKHAFDDASKSSILNYKFISAFLSIIIVILSIIIGKGIIAIGTAINIYTGIIGIVVAGFTSFLAYKFSQSMFNKKIKILKETISNKFGEFKETLISDGSESVTKNVVNSEIDRIINEVKSSDDNTKEKNISILGNLIQSITGFLSTDSSGDNKKPLQKSITINGIIYTSLIEPNSNSIDNLLLNVTSNYGIMDTLNSVDDMFARMKVGKKLKQTNTEYFQQNILFNKRQREEARQKAEIEKGKTGEEVKKGGKPKNTRMKRRTRRSKRYNKTKKVKPMKYI